MECKQNQSSRRYLSNAKRPWVIAMAPGINIERREVLSIRI